MGDSADVAVRLGAKTKVAELQSLEISEKEDSLPWNSSFEDRQSLDQEPT